MTDPITPSTPSDDAPSMPAPAEPDPRLPRLSGVAGFNEFVAKDWGDPDRTAPVVAGFAKAAADHRARLSGALPGRSLVVVAGVAPRRINDTFHEFRAHSDFVWLTGCGIEDAVLVMTPTGSGHEARLFVPRPFRPGDPGFYGSAARGELWVGSAPDLHDWSDALGLDVRDADELAPVVDGLRDPLVVGHEVRPAALAGSTESAELAGVLARLRMVKDDFEIAQLRSAVDATVRGFADTVGQIPTALAAGGERWLQGTFDRTARTLGNGPGYASIVGSGTNAATLHWVRTDGDLHPDHALLLDMGVEARSGYTADVTRTFPVSGTFSTAQRDVHDLAERAHRAGLDAVRPGRVFSDFYAASLEVIAHGLADWGLLPVSVDEALSPTGQQHRRWIVCGIGHHLGLDVHDCAQAEYAAYQDGMLEPGMVLTVEPGLYFHAHDLAVPPELRGIGVRIEDDVLVTADGIDVLSDALPIDAAGVEAWMAARLG